MEAIATSIVEYSMAVRETSLISSPPITLQASSSSTSYLYSLFFNRYVVQIPTTSPLDEPMNPKFRDLYDIYNVCSFLEDDIPFHQSFANMIHSTKTY